MSQFMNTLGFPILLFLVGFACLIKGGDWFVDGASGLAHRLHIPELIIGATVVAIGTTLPEVMVSATAAVQGQSETAYGNAIGSIICNTALISALTFAIRPTTVDGKSFRGPVLFYFAAAAFYCIISYTTGYFSRWCGFVLLAGFVFYMIYTVVKGRKAGMAAASEEEETADEMPLWKELLLLVIGAALIAVGAKLLVDNGTKIASAIGVPESVIALTFVALGTSLPELVTAVTALVKGHSALSLGNIVGANLFNLVFVSGMAITLRPFSIPASKTIAGMNASLVVDLPLMVFVMAFMTIPALVTGKLKRWQGITLLTIYAAYCVFQFVL